MTTIPIKAVLDIFYQPAEGSSVNVLNGALAEKKFSYKSTIWFCFVFVPFICQKH